MSQERWYRCGTGATGCPKAETGEAFCVKESEYDGWKCPHSKFCKDALIRVPWAERHRGLVTILYGTALLALAGAGAFYYFNRPESAPVPATPPLAINLKNTAVAISQPTQQPAIPKPPDPPAHEQQPEPVTPPPPEKPPEESRPASDEERIEDKLRDALKPAIPEAIKPLPIQRFYFDQKKTELDAKLRPYLAEAAEKLAKPEYQGKYLAVVGFADAKGTDKVNCPLSETRAKTVAQELGKKISLPIKPLGLCSTRPIGDNNTAEGQQMNRRVELWTYEIHQ
ncbi:MAG: OmpA family protein [Candidatus Methylumidiphilus sp.]